MRAMLPSLVKMPTHPNQFRAARLACRCLIPALLLLLANGCATGLGPKTIRTEQPDYNQQIVHSGDEQMVLNLVRLRYNDTPLFLELGTVVAQYAYNASLNAAGQWASNPSTSQGNLGLGLGYSETPTITYTPLSGAEYAERMLIPIPLDSLMLFNQTGWSQERLLLIAVQRINNVFNAPTATGPTPEVPPDYKTFQELAERLRSLQMAGLVGLNWEMRDNEKQPPGRNSQFWIHPPASPDSPLAADEALVRRDLELTPGKESFRLTAFPFERQPGEIGMRCRSLLGVLYYLSQSVIVPAPHVEQGLVTVTRDEQGKPFDWSQVTGRVLTIRSQKDRPVSAAIAVKYRGWWFYIADNDQNSKSTFSLLNILFSLQSASASGKSPVLTLPLGQ
jgi:hypothetical protein